MSLIDICQNDYPILKKYIISYFNPDSDEELESLELYIFPEDFKSTYEPKYSKLNSYGVYPYINLRTHSVTVRYGSRYIVDKLEKLAIKSLDTGIPLQFGTASDYSARPNSLEDPPISFITNEEFENFSNIQDAIDREKEIEEEKINYEKLLRDNLLLLKGFLELPITVNGVIGKGDIIDGFSFKIIETNEYFRSLKVGDLIFKIPPESYSYQEVGSNGSIQYAIDNSVIINVGFVQKGFTINLPSAYTDVLETLKFYKQYSLIRGGIEILDGVGNSFNGWGYVNNLSYSGAINRKLDDVNENSFLPNGLSFSVLSLESFITS